VVEVLEELEQALDLLLPQEQHIQLLLVVAVLVHHGEWAQMVLLLFLAFLLPLLAE
jgi:hypothetical protein